jgi:hypothetical protein
VADIKQTALKAQLEALNKTANDLTTASKAVADACNSALTVARSAIAAKAAKAVTK